MQRQQLRPGLCEAIVPGIASLITTLSTNSAIASNSKRMIVAAFLCAALAGVHFLVLLA